MYRVTSFWENERQFETAADVARYIAKNIDEAHFCEHIDENNEAVTVLGKVYKASEVLCECDFDDYKSRYNSFCGSMRGEIFDRVSRLENGQVAKLFDFNIKRIDNEQVFGTAVRVGAQVFNFKNAEQYLIFTETLTKMGVPWGRAEQ